jgi:lysophospholipase L1-like esterase
MTAPAGLPVRQPARKWRTLAAALAVLLATSLGTNAYLAHSARSYYQTALALRLDPVGLKVYESERAKAAADDPVLVLFGDSRALMWAEPPRVAGYRVVNRGIGFQTTAQILMRVESDVVPLHPAVVVLEAGVNDLKTIAQMPELRSQIVADCESNLQRIVDRCRQAGATVVVVSVFGIGDVDLLRRPFWSDDVATAVREVNGFLPRLASGKVVFFDADPVLGSGGRIQRDYQLDYLHLKPAGYEALNGRLVPLLGGLPR